jgi:hypothetical protein
MRGEEILSGAQRIHDAAFLETKMREKGVEPDTMKAYVDAFRWGCPPHAGAGFGCVSLSHLLAERAIVDRPCFAVVSNASSSSTSTSATSAGPRSSPATRPGSSPDLSPMPLYETSFWQERYRQGDEEYQYACQPRHRPTMSEQRKGAGMLRAPSPSSPSLACSPSTSPRFPTTIQQQLPSQIR